MRVHPENWQNNEQDLLVWIERHLDQFSKGQRRIGEYLLAHYDKAAFMTAAKLGSTVGVSESTVVRFATEIGFDGYPSFQKDLESIVRNRLTTVQRCLLYTSRRRD